MNIEHCSKPNNNSQQFQSFITQSNIPSDQKINKEGWKRENLNSRLSGFPLPPLYFSRHFRIGRRKQVGGIDQPTRVGRDLSTRVREFPRARSKGRPAQFRGTITIVIDATRQTRARKLRKYGWENVAGRKRKFVFPSNDSNLSCAPPPPLPTSSPTDRNRDVYRDFPL